MRRVAMARAFPLSSSVWADKATKGTLVLKQNVGMGARQARKGQCSYAANPCATVARSPSSPALSALRSLRCVASPSATSSAPSPAEAGIIQSRDEALCPCPLERVSEYLNSEGIDTSQLAEIMLPSTVEVVKERLAFLRELGLDNEAINSYPLMISCSIKKNMVPVLDYLEKLGISRRSLPDFLKKYPMVLHASVVIDLLPVIDYLKGLDIGTKDIPGVLLRFPDILGFKLEGTMSTSVAYLVSIGVNMREIGPMLTKYPEILGMRVATIIKPKVDYLISLGLPKSTVARILVRRPQLLGYGLKETVQPAVDDLLEAGIQEDRVADIIVQCPEILGQRLGTVLEEKIAWLTQEVKVLPGDIPGMIERLPQVLFIKEGLAMERVGFLKKAGFSHTDIAKMVADCPQILALSIDQALEPSLDFIKHDMGRTIKELIDFPAFFTYSLETRIRPRYKLVAEKGIKCSLSWFLNCSDDRFMERIKAEVLDEEEAGPVVEIGGHLVAGLGKFSKEQVDSDDQRMQRICARERIGSANVDYFSDGSESEEGEDHTYEEVDDVMNILSDKNQSEDDVKEDFAYSDGQRTQRIHARERLGSANMDYFYDRSESEEGEDHTDEEVDDVMNILSDKSQSEGDVNEDFAYSDGQRTQRIHARERLGPANMDHFSDRSESEEGEDHTDEEVDDVINIFSDKNQSEDDVNEDFASDMDSDDDSELMGSEDEPEFIKSSSWEGTECLK